MKTIPITKMQQIKTTRVAVTVMATTAWLLQRNASGSRVRGRPGCGASDLFRPNVNPTARG